MNVTPYYQWGKNFADKLDLSAYKNILDIGCRQGLISYHLAKKYPEKHITAIDNLAEEIAHAKNFSLSNLNFETADVLQLSYTDYFDTIVSFNCLLWVKDKATALKNIFNSLKPGKKFFIQLFILHGRPKNDRFLYQTAKSPKWQNYFSNFFPNYYEVTFTELSALLQGTGFIINRMEFALYPAYFTHSDELLVWLKSWVAHTNRIPVCKQDHFLRDTVSAYLDFYYYHDHNTIPYSEYYLEIECEKPILAFDDPAYSSYHYRNVRFTSQEARVLKYFLLGKTGKEISRSINISAKTVEFHLGNIKEKLQVKYRSQIYQSALDYGFIHLLFNPTL